MRIKVWLSACLVFFTTGVFAQNDTIQATIVLIGDAGELTNGRHPVVEAAKKTVKMDEKTTILYLGDNLYKTGLPDDAVPNFAIAKAPLDSQIHITRGNTKTKVYFIPGNHDWANGGKNGYESILRVQSYIDILGNELVKMLPRDGCPGPVEIEVNDDVTMILMDSQWWLHEEDKPGVESDCPFKTEAEILTELDEILAKNSRKMILFATHHPFRSYGPHGGYFTLKQHIFPLTDAKPNLYIPLPVLGSAYPLTRAVFGTAQDLQHPLYQNMINDVEEVIKGHPNVIYAAGHEHGLQLIQDSGYNFIVSGGGCKMSRVSKSRNTKFAEESTGFATLQVSVNKNVRITFYEVHGDSIKNVYSENILDFSKVPELPKDTLREVDFVYKDTVVISASDQYKKLPGKFGRFILGNNYRNVWNEPVTFKIFNINKEQGGFKIKSLGGGKQTKSLKLEDKNGKEWSLRTIEKDPEMALPVNLRSTLAKDVVSDVISASDPYAPLAVAVLAKAAGIPAAAPRYFFVPDDPSLGYYRPLFANKVVTLEDRDPVADNDTKSTNKIQNKLYEDIDDKIDQPAVLNARLLDILIADFDRHADQWKWGTKDTGKGKLYYPVPRDRDQAFFKSDGLLVGYLSRRRMAYLKGFTPRIKKINEFSFAARDFDRTFLNAINEKKWKEVADSFVVKITDDVIVEAANAYPREIKPMRTQKVIKTLKSRREQLVKESLKYYRFISRDVNINGSNQSEFFHLSNDSGRLNVKVYKISKKDRDTTSLIYNRSFEKKVTDELRIYGLNGDDKFYIDNDVSSRIKVRIIGGKGTDTFNIAGNNRTHIYDLSTENNMVLQDRRVNNHFSSDVNVNSFNDSRYQYDRVHIPRVNAGFNAEDGILLGVGLWVRRFGFRKNPYAYDHKFGFLIAPSRDAAYQFKYHGELNQLFNNKDVVLNAEFVNPTLNSFFGIGNRTEFDKDKGVDYYRVRYKYVSGDALIRVRPTSFMNLSAGPSFYHYWNDYSDNDNKILANIASNNIQDSLQIFSNKIYTGFRVKMDIDYTNSEVFPTRGLRWITDFSQLYGMNDQSLTVGKITTDMTIYAKVSDLSKFSSVLRVGAGHIFNDRYDYFQAVNLGANNFLRGFRKNRFSGRTMFYAGTDLKYSLFRAKSKLLAGDVGAIGFYELGRVWAKNTDNGSFHHSYGGGFYFAPFDLILLSATIGISDENALFNFTLGTRFNLTF
jgi:hypothetical protein